MLKRWLLQRVGWMGVALLAIWAAVAGLLQISMYYPVVSHDLLPAVWAPDLLSVLSGLVLLVIAARARASYKSQIVGLGILGYYFYNYGVYTIERVYTPYYLHYLTIFAGSFWLILAAIASLEKQVVAKVSLPKVVRWVSTGLALLQPLVFIPLWVSQLIPLMREGIKIEYLYSVYILDLAIIMPAFLILVYKMVKKEGAALLLSPVIFILGFLVIGSLGLAELVKPYFEAEPGVGGVVQSAILSGAFLLMAIWHVKKLSIR